MAVDHLFAVRYLATDAEYRRLKASMEAAQLGLEIIEGEISRHQWADSEVTAR